MRIQQEFAGVHKLCTQKICTVHKNLTIFRTVCYMNWYVCNTVKKGQTTVK